MRRLCLLAPLVVLFMLPAAAQEAVPDTTQPARYFPLAVGNTWTWMVGGVSPDWYDHIVLETESAGTFAGARTRSRPAPGGGYTVVTDPVTLRYDAGTEIVYLGDGEYEWAFVGTECGLGVDFGGAPGEASDVPCTARGEGVVRTSGGYEQPFHVGADPFTGATKYVVAPGPCCAEASFAAGVGPLQWSSGDLVPFRDLMYARVSGVEYGEPTVLETSEPVPMPRVTSIRRAYPNPFDDAFTLTVAHPRTGPLVVEVFDVLGRRVYAERPVVPVGLTDLHITLPDGAPGIYTARIRSASDTWPARPKRLVRAL